MLLCVCCEFVLRCCSSLYIQCCSHCSHMYFSSLLLHKWFIKMSLLFVLTFRKHWYWIFLISFVLSRCLVYCRYREQFRIKSRTESREESERVQSGCQQSLKIESGGIQPGCQSWDRGGNSRNWHLICASGDLDSVLINPFRTASLSRLLPSLHSKLFSKRIKTSR